MTDQDAVLRAARLFGFVREQPRDSNAGQAVEAFLGHCGLGKGHPWCAAFVCFVLDGALGNLNRLKRTASCQALADQALALQLLKTVPAASAIFLLWNENLQRFAHTGFVLSLDTTACGTIEGNTNDGGSRDGYGVFLRQRTFGPKDRFIWWWL